jgi:hypothetical protein
MCVIDVSLGFFIYEFTYLFTYADTRRNEHTHEKTTRINLDFEKETHRVGYHKESSKL